VADWRSVFRSDGCIAHTQVANLVFLKPDFEILAFFEHLWLFLEIKKSRTKSGFFSVGKAWTWKNVVGAAYSIYSIFIH